MPEQEVFFDQELAGRRVEVLKTYDSRYAREAFDKMDEASQDLLWDVLGINDAYDPVDIPPAHTGDRIDFLWGELQDAAREDGNLLSFFVVNEARGSAAQSLYVSPDWPSAEQFARKRLEDHSGKPLASPNPT